MLGRRYNNKASLVASILNILDPIPNLPLVKETLTMNTNIDQLSLNFEQILELVKQLPYSDKLRLSKELEKETLNQKLTQLLEAFQTDELSLETINEEVEAVRAELYARKQTY